MHRASELKSFIEHDKKLVFRAGCVYFEFTHDVEDIDPDKEVIVMNKVSGMHIIISH